MIKRNEINHLDPKDCETLQSWVL